MPENGYLVFSFIMKVSRMLNIQQSMHFGTLSSIFSIASVLQISSVPRSATNGSRNLHGSVLRKRSAREIALGSSSRCASVSRGALFTTAGQESLPDSFATVLPVYLEDWKRVKALLDVE